MTSDGLSLLGPVFADDPRVRFAYVFGSVAAGTARPDSDIDLAVSVAPRGTLLDDARLHDALVAKLGREDVEIIGSRLDDFDRFAEQITAYADRA